MLGAIIGDIVGSRFEWNNIKTKDFEFMTYRCQPTDALGIERNDIDGILELNLEQHSYDILIYDNVPGGAGHVKRLVDREAVISSLRAAHTKVSQQCCDENTSCYNCLRNY